jgi:hypothetical protein
MAAINEALVCLNQMLDSGPIPGIIVTLKQLLTELEQLRSLGMNPPMQEVVEARDSAIDHVNLPSTIDMDTALSGMEPIMSGQRQTQFMTGLQHEHGSLLDMSWPHLFPFDGKDLDQALFAPNLGDYFNPEPSAMLN